MLLQIRDLNTYYGASHVLQGISLDVAQGELVALLGRNGMGKSTTLKTVMGLVKARSGSVTFDEREITGAAPFKVARAGIGYVPEERRIFPELSVLDNLSLGIKGGRISNPDDPGGLDRRTDLPSLPTAERPQGSERALPVRRRAAAAGHRPSPRATPRLLLVDEPTEGLAPLMVKEVRNVLAEINRAGVSILLVEHNLKVALSLAHRVYLMGKAHIGFNGTVDELKDDRAAREKYLEV